MDKQEKIVKGIFGLGILLVMLVIATGTVSADTEITSLPYTANTADERYYLTGDLTCTDNSAHGITIGNNNITIDGQSHKITGNKSANACSCDDEDAPENADCGIYNNGHDNVTIKNLEVENFCHGIVLKGASTSNKVENNTIDNCTVHNNGVDGANCLNHGILLMYTANSTVSNNTVCNNTGEVVATCDTGGHGIRLYKYSDYNNVTNNTIYNNTLAGIYSKMRCEYNNVTYNKVYENGKVVGGATAYFGGGIRLECYNTNYWNVSYNTVTDNTGPGIHVRGDHNNITHNDVTNNKNASTNTECAYRGIGDGIYLCGDYNNVTYNRVCNNNGTDIYNHSDATGNTFDENICNTSHPDGLCEYPCVYAYKYQVNNNPGANDPNIEFNTTEYANARVDDDVRACNKTTTDDYYAAHRFNFTVREPASKIKKINVTWNGIGDHDSSTDGAKLYIYNFSAGAGYEELDSSTTGGPLTEITLTNETTSSISNYINSNNVTILVNQTSAQTPGMPPARSHIKTDLAKIVIYFEYP